MDIFKVIQQLYARKLEIDETIAQLEKPAPAVRRAKRKALKKAAGARR